MNRVVQFVFALLVAATLLWTPVGACAAQPDAPTHPCCPPKPVPLPESLRPAGVYLHGYPCDPRRLTNWPDDASPVSTSPSLPDWHRHSPSCLHPGPRGHGYTTPLAERFESSTRSSFSLAPLSPIPFARRSMPSPGLPLCALLLPLPRSAVRTRNSRHAGMTLLPGVTAAPVPAAPGAGAGRVLPTNFGFRTEVMSQFTVSAVDNTASRQSVGFEVLKKFSSATATFASFNFQGRMVRRDRFQAISNDMEGAARPGWTFEYHNAYVDFYNVFGSRHPGRFHLRACRFYLPFGLNLQTDTHGTVLQLSNDRNFGFERDWYTGLYGTLNRHLNYDAYYLAGSGYGLRFRGQQGLAGGRVSLAEPVCEPVWVGGRGSGADRGTAQHDPRARQGGGDAAGGRRCAPTADGAERDIDVDRGSEPGARTTGCR